MYERKKKKNAGKDLDSEGSGRVLKRGGEKVIMEKGELDVYRFSRGGDGFS